MLILRGVSTSFNSVEKEKHVVLSTFWGKDPWTELLGTQLDLTKPAPNQKNVTDISIHIRRNVIISTLMLHSPPCSASSSRSMIFTALTLSWPFNWLLEMTFLPNARHFYLKGLGEVMCLQGENLDPHCTHIQQESTHLLKHQGISEEAKR